MYYFITKLHFLIKITPFFSKQNIQVVYTNKNRGQGITVNVTLLWPTISSLAHTVSSVAHTIIISPHISSTHGILLPAFIILPLARASKSVALYCYCCCCCGCGFGCGGCGCGAGGCGAGGCGGCGSGGGGGGFGCGGGGGGGGSGGRRRRRVTSSGRGWFTQQSVCFMTLSTAYKIFMSLSHYCLPKWSPFSSNIVVCSSAKGRLTGIFPCFFPILLLCV